MYGSLIWENFVITPTNLLNWDFVHLSNISIPSLANQGKNVLKSMKTCITEAVPHWCSSDKLLCKYVANLQEDTHVEVGFQ